MYKLPQLNRLLHTSSLPSDVTYLLYEIVRALPALSDGQGLVENYYVYLPALNAVVAPSQGFVHLEKYYDAYFRIDPEQSFDQWREMLLSISGRSLLGSWRNDSGIFDGATILQRIWYVDLPGILPTICIMLIMRCGQVLNVGYEKVYLLQNAMNLNASEVINTYVYKQGLSSGLPQYSLATAIGLFVSVVNLIVLAAVNRLSASVSGNSLW